MNGKKSKKSSGKKKMKGENHIISLFEAYFSNVDILCLKKKKELILTQIYALS